VNLSECMDTNVPEPWLWNLIGSGRWLCAVTRTRIVAVPGEGPPAPADAAALIAGYLVDCAATHTTTLAELRAWVGGDEPEPECAVCGGAKVMRCRRCKGAGETEHECSEYGCYDTHMGPCRECEGDKTEECACAQPRGPRSGRVGRLVLDRRLFDPALATLANRHGETVVSIAVPRDPLDRLTLWTGDEWKLVVMPMRAAVGAAEPLALRGAP
jgi:hypothetical protein